ncbi:MULTISPECIES: isochorismatase family protein [unclassified Brevibacterium]|uniref:isochorismatase family protein n=1 Tax=unclassified Brevibacterium TaxID=2614124 RepID=UPI000C6B4117|nr:MULTISPECIES: isochorismatase family protein [unclassified Brevibacterium]SMX95987.1 Nicotinamidase-related amidase [Brevibacterium sp. 239c]
MSTPRRALVLVDVQQQYFDGLLEIQYPSHEQSLPKITAAIDAAVAADIPVAVFQHTMGTDAPVFNPNEPGYALHPEVERRRSESWKSVVKEYGSVYADTDLEAWLREKDVDTVTLVGYMTNNCILSSAAGAEVLGFTTEVLSDATGAINIANDAGFADAKTVHTTLMALLHSNWASVATTDAWTKALTSQVALPKGDLGSSAATGAQKAGQN